MDRGRDRDQPFFFGVSEKAGHCARSPGHCRPGAPPFLKRLSVKLEVGTAYREQLERVLLAERNELPKVERVSLAGQAPVAGEEAGQGQALMVGENEVGDCRDGRSGYVMTLPPEPVGLGGLRFLAPQPMRLRPYGRRWPLTSSLTRSYVLARTRGKGCSLPNQYSVLTSGRRVVRGAICAAGRTLPGPSAECRGRAVTTSGAGAPDEAVWPATSFMARSNLYGCWA
jgi:hypothetical protein